MGFDKTWTIKWTNDDDKNIIINYTICNCDEYRNYRGYRSGNTDETPSLVGWTEHRSPSRTS